MKELLILVTLFLASGRSEVKVKVISKLTQDLIRNENFPSVLSALTCWSMPENLYFLKTSPIPVQLNGHMNIPLQSVDENTSKMWYFIDMRCPGSHEQLNKIQAALFSHPYRWILLEPDESRLTNFSFLVDSNMLLVNFDPELNRYDLKQVYKIDDEQKNFISEIFGYWNEDNGLTDLRMTRILSRRRKDLRGKLLKSVVIVMNNESISQLDDLNNAQDSLGKMGYVITNILADSVNTSVTYDFVNTWGYGDMNHPEKLKGMIGPLARNEIHISGTVLFMTTDRLQYFEYLSVTLPTRGAFLFRAPPLSYVSNIYYLPFDHIVWICSIFLAIICTTIIFITYRLSRNNDNDMKTSDFFLFAISTVCQMGSNLIPKKSSGRIATFVFLSLIFLYTSYTANIVALLQSTSPNIRTLDDLVNSNIETSVDDTPFNRHYFSIETEPVRKKIYETRIAPPNKPKQFVNMTYGISMVRKGLYAFHSELGIGYKYVKETFFEHEKCSLRKIEFLQQLDPWHAAPKKSPYKEIFKVNLFKIREHGIQTIEKARRYTDPPICSSSGQNFESVRITECYAPFLVLCYGIVIALILFIFESAKKFKWFKCLNIC